MTNTPRIPRVSIPPLYSPFAAAIYPGHDAIEGEAQEWARRYIPSADLGERLVQQDIGRFASRILPDGNPEVIALLAKYIVWLFGVDDGYCEESALGESPGELGVALSQLVYVAQNPQANLLADDLLAAGLRDVQNELSRHATDTQKARWVDALREYILSVGSEAHYRSTEEIPDLDAYTVMRLYDGATTAVLPFLEIGCELRPDERDRDDIRALTQMASLIITWDNDILSYHKESRGDRYYLNALRILEHQRGLTPADAMSAVIQQRDRVLNLFIAVSDESSRQASPQLRRYLRGLGNFIRAGQDWGISSLRYTTPHDPAHLPTHFSDTAVHDESLECVDIQAIAWWWKFLPDSPHNPPSRFGGAQPAPPGEMNPAIEGGAGEPAAAADLRAAPRAPGWLPLLGHALPLSRDPFAFLTSLRDTGALVRLSLGTMPAYAITSPDLTRQVMTSRDWEKGRLFDRMRELVGDGLATANAVTHHQHRRLMQPLFHNEQSARYAEIVTDRACAMARSWQPGTELDVAREMAEHAIRTLTQALFSATVDKTVVDATRRNVPILLKYMLFRAVCPKALDGLPIAANRRFDRAQAALRQVINGIIARQSAGGGGGLLEGLLTARDEEGNGLSDIEVADELVTLLFAGGETVATCLAWGFYEIARQPEVEEALFREIDMVVGEGPVTIEHVKRLTYLRQVVDEITRLYGVTLLMRRAVTDVQLGGFTLPEGTEVLFSPYALQRDPELYPDPEHFDPNRWSGDRPRAFLPFGAGSRQCIGKEFAVMEMVITLATVLSRWRLRLVPGHTPHKTKAAMPYPDRVLMEAVLRSP